MTSAKSYKILILLTAFIMAITAGLCALNFGTASAAASEPTKYFSGISASDMSFKDGKLNAVVNDGDVLNITRELAIDDFNMVLVLPEANTFESVTVKFTSASKLPNGNLKDGKLETKIVHSVTFDSALSGEQNVSVTVDDNGAVTINSSTFDQNYDLIKNVGIATAKVSFEFALPDGVENTTFAIKSINQKVSDADGNYEQTFETDASGVLTDTAYPRVAISSASYVNDGSGYKLVYTANKEVTPSFSVYSVLGDVSTSSIYIEKTTEGTVQNGDRPKWIMFGNEGEKTFKVTYSGVAEGKYLESFAVTVIKDGTDEKAPVYIKDDYALDAFKQAVIDASTDENGNSIPLGTDFVIPSFEGLVFDDTVPYESLSVTVYILPEQGSETTASDMSFAVDAGEYVFCVSFSDGTNSIEKSDFYEIDGDTLTEGKYFADYKFTFKIQDNAPISIETSPVPGVAYKGIKYTASAFKIDADGCDTTYTLYYNADKNANQDSDGWVVIPKESSVTDQDYTDDYGNTYSSVKSVAYDGERTFKPTKYGSYMIKCYASSEHTIRTAEAYSIVRVTDAPTYVEVPSTWLRDNVWSVVFLSVGTLCLIGIIVLLFIKPKEETESE